jgi:hypothetical protein
MKFTLYGFKKFIEDMDPTPEKSRDSSMGDNSDKSSDKEDYFAVLGDEMGIEWKDIVKALKEPQVSAHFGIGKDPDVMYKLSAWEIVPGSMTPQGGASIRLKPQKRDRSYLHGNRLNKSSYKDTKEYHLGREELEKFITTGWTPALQGQSGPPAMS